MNIDPSPASAASLGSALQAATQAIGRLEARLLLQHVTGLTASALLAHPEHALHAEPCTRYQALVARRAAGEPMAYLLGQREFYGRDFSVAPGVLIPRPETELLVEQGLAKIAGIQATPVRVLDLGCGSGCIGISLALERTDAQVTAVDASREALAISQQNAARHQASLRLLHGDWFNALAPAMDDTPSTADTGTGFHLIVSNPPYIAADDPHLQQGDLRHEPGSALASGKDGLDALRQIISQAPRWLQHGGWLLCEHGYDQASAVRTLLQQAGYQHIEQHRDLAGIVRVSGGCWLGREAATMPVSKPGNKP